MGAEVGEELQIRLVTSGRDRDGGHSWLFGRKQCLVCKVSRPQMARKKKQEERHV